MTDRAAQLLATLARARALALELGPTEHRNAVSYHVREAVAATEQAAAADAEEDSDG